MLLNAVSSLSPVLRSHECPSGKDGASFWPKNCGVIGKQRHDLNQQRTSSFLGSSGLLAVPHKILPTSRALGAIPLVEQNGIVIQNARGPADFELLARIRAEAYYENDRSRFVNSFKAKFTNQEACALGERTTPKENGYPGAVCLVATEDAVSVVGGLDVRLPRRLSGIHPEGVPPQDDRGCFVANVVVRESDRGRGIGSALMEAAKKLATDLKATAMYTQVEAGNKVASSLYSRYGFKEASVVDCLDSNAVLGKTLLLKCDLHRED